MIEAVENSIFALLHDLGAIFLFFTQIVKTLFSTRGNVKPILSQIASISFRSMSTVIFAGIFVGAIIVLQFNLILSNYDAESMLGGLNTSTIIREVGPLIISFLLAGKVGAFIAAELGSMRVTDQIDAIECLGVNPIQYLIVPRFMGIFISNLFLLMIGLMFSIAGSLFIGSVVCNVNYLEFLVSIPKFSTMWTLAGGIFKSMIYGSIVAIVSCHKGFTASGGARGVGRAVTSAAVYTNFYILIASYCTNHFLEFFEKFVNTVRGVYP